MRRLPLALVVLAAAGSAVAAQPETVDELRDELEAIQRDYQQMKDQYESRIEDLEQRIDRIETQPAGRSTGTSAAGGASDRAFNPAVGVIVNGALREFGRDPAGFSIPGFALGPETGPGEEGFSLGETEFNFYANIDDKFFGSVTAAIADAEHGTEVELEEAYVETLALPAGATLKAGRFFSHIGYLNQRHVHTDDFVDRPLPYRAFLAKKYGDDGLHLRWLAPTPLFVELGGEIMRGDAFPAGGGADDGKGAFTLFGHMGGDAGPSHSWRAGLSWFSAEAQARGSGAEDAPDRFTGDTDLFIADVVWKWAPQGRRRQRELILQGELFGRNEAGTFTPNGASALELDADQWGGYLQGVYRWSPRWQGGLRYAWLHADDPGTAFDGTALDTNGHEPWLGSAVVEWRSSEFARVRFQYNRDESRPEPDDQIMLQYIMSLGAHGAHLY